MNTLTVIDLKGVYSNYSAHNLRKRSLRRKRFKFGRAQPNNKRTCRPGELTFGTSLNDDDESVHCGIWSKTIGLSDEFSWNISFEANGFNEIQCESV